MAVENGNKVKIEYKGTLDDGTIFDSSEAHSEPLEFEMGAGQVIPGFEDAVMGMNKGEEKIFKLQPDEAYGDHNPELIKAVPRDQMPADQEPEAGMMLITELPDGAKLPAVITEVTDETVTIDLNHPLAGKALTFEIKIVDVAS
ncbi:MAG: peptidylprolyl isomerase [Thermoplasmata archaeon]|nr:peptidylprolyl isomerase [Thermoplasmata archaeon]